MNFAIVVGVLIEKPIVRKSNGSLVAYFRVGVLSEATGNSTYILCSARGKVGQRISTVCKEGTPIVVRGTIEYNKDTKTNFIEATYVEILFNSMSKEVQMGIKEFLEIYKPQDAMKAVKQLMKEQEEEEKKCMPTESTSDT
jgi:hypothetical protein